MPNVLNKLIDFSRYRVENEHITMPISVGSITLSENQTGISRKSPASVCADLGHKSPQNYDSRGTVFVFFT